ncbi:TonB-dependent receptor plug domain-containing protein [Sphingobacterium oryzagri]|uniref:TonB-dependent receptor plug domain-containing protein n=1 Tax=Sphingobacterium oryzagri TaxID=3025669 RepID=A0ABY7WQW3_9SPHI|nr:TonB-dependent receptor plug domain-containing protein [Sphingobacterium sp. KACC 22765]WDF70720.1 TonB-dependent receptor plug domain-containing protein [Sphingobacterium sp. KACC 22765]
MNKFLCVVIIWVAATLHVCAQNTAGILIGKVIQANGMPLEGATIAVAHSKRQTVTDEHGKYVIRLPLGEHVIACSYVGFKTVHKTVKLVRPGKHFADFTIDASAERKIDDVEVSSKTAITNVRESPYNVVALDAKSFYNTNLDLAHLLDKASGVNIRESGGVGSDLSVSLNGFTGRYVKIFMDGVPMQGFGSAFQLNNIPVNIADRIEVYKGVVPIEFGTDAIGGVINIVTNQTANTYVDASYSYGSFNTHRTNVSFGHTTKKGFTFQLNAFQNYSDNSYRVKTRILDVATGNYSMEDQWVRRFHDTYHNETIMAKVGFVNKPWADRLLFGLTLGQEQADIQHANIMQVAFGKRERNGHSVLPSISYEKKNLFIKNLNLNVNGNYNRNYNQNIDTAAAQYSWNGDYRVTNTIGESAESMAEFYNNNGSVTANLGYTYKEKHRFRLNNVFTGYERRNADERAFATDLASASDTMVRRSFKNILGFEYQLQYNKNWVTSMFLKSYAQDVTGPVDTSSVASRSSFAQQDRAFSAMGYGIASTYLFRDFQIKASFEKAYRLPTDNELFGDEVLEVGNSTLRAENSLNYNLGVAYHAQIRNDHNVYADVSFLYRDTRDYIRRIASQAVFGASAGTASSENHGRVANMGVNVELRYNYKNKLDMGGTFTYQNLRDRERFSSSFSTLPSLTYNDRVPNVPYAFGNFDANYNFSNMLKMNDVLTVGYALNYIHEFFLRWEGNGADKHVVPGQLSHDANVTYVFAGGKYNLAFEARNFSNELLYDNFSLQKPGRAFSVKFRYYFMKKH